MRSNQDDPNKWYEKFFDGRECFTCGDKYNPKNICPKNISLQVIEARVDVLDLEDDSHEAEPANAHAEAKDIELSAVSECITAGANWSNIVCLHSYYWLSPGFGSRLI